METSTKHQKPHEIRIGKVKASIWANENDRGKQYSVKLRCLYKDESGQWQSTDTFQLSDLLVAAKVADLAHTWICRQGAK